MLHLTLFGQMQARGASGRDVIPRSRKTRAVLAILALAAPRPVLRTKLTALLWSSRAPEQGRASLRQSVHELQRSLDPAAAALLQSARNHLLLSEDRLAVDVFRLRRATVEQPQGLEVFQHSFLEDLNGLDPALDEWLLEERRRLMQWARSVAEGVLAAQTSPSSRIASAERLLLIDRAHEKAWETLITTHLAMADRSAARIAYEHYTESLSQIGLPPADRLQRLLLSRPEMVAAGPGARAAARGPRLRVLPPRALDYARLDGVLSGLPEEISAAVSRFRWISCETVHSAEATLHGGADYELDTTLQRSGEMLRVIIRLLDHRDGGQVLWARRVDRQLGDVLTLQDEIASNTAAGIDNELLLQEGVRRSAGRLEDATAFDLTLLAIRAIYRLEPRSFHVADGLLARAIELEPENAAAHAWWAYWHLFSVGQAWTDDPPAAARRAGELAERAVTLDPGDARALTLAGHVRGFLHKRAAEACSLHERALSLNPNLPLAWCFSGLARSYLGDHGVAIEHIERAKWLSPHDPHAFFFYMALMMPHFLRGDYHAALACGRLAVELNAGFSSTYKGYLATLGQLGHAEEAQRVRTRLLELEPGFCVRTAIERSPMTRKADLDAYAAGLRLAGLPNG